MPSELRIGVIGCGGSAMEMCQGIAAAPNANVAMLMDPRPEVLSDLAEMFGAPTTPRAGEVLANPDVDTVYVAAPYSQRAPIGIQAAAAGKHVLVEPPMATTLADADALIAACQRHGVTLGVAFLGSVDGGMAAARNLVRGGALGEITAVRIMPRAGATGKDDALMGEAIHELNTVRWVTGLEVKRVYAEAAIGDKGEGTVGAVLRYHNGAVGVLQAALAVQGGAHEDWPGPRLYGAKGQLILTAYEPLVWLAEPPEGSPRGAWQAVRHGGPRGGRSEIVRRFAAAVLASEEPPSTGLDGRKALEIVLAAYRSGERHEPVSLPLEA